jgi:hypothetical protein
MISDGDADGTGKIQLSDLQTLIAGGALQASNNLNDVANKSTSFSNLMKGADSPSADQYDSFVVVATAGEGHYPGIRTRGNIADDLASVGGLMKGSNNLSDLTDVDTSVENLTSGTEVTYSSLHDNARVPIASPSFPAYKGYAKLSSIWSWIKGKIASVLGLEENSGTLTYSGTAAQATTALNFQVSVTGNNYKIVNIISAQQSMSGDGTVTFSSSDDLPLDAVVLGAMVTGNGGYGVTIKNIEAVRTKSAQSTGSLTVTVNVTASTIGPGNPSVFNISLFVLTAAI